jgi:transposase InsO family protein
MLVSRSGYYDYRHLALNKKISDEERLLLEVKALAASSRNSLGKRRMSKHLKAKGYNVGVYAARTLMKKAGIECKQRRRYQVTTQSKHALPVAKNVLNRQFEVEAPNRVWVADITYIWTLEGWLYVAAVLDLFSRRIVGWAIAAHMKESLVSDALCMALGRRNPEAGLMQHSDQGVQYACHAYQALLKTHGITVSMSRKGNCWDNAVMERFWGSLKSERTNGKIYHSREEAKQDIVDYIEMYYNNVRLHSHLNYCSPAMFEQQYERAVNERVSGRHAA